RSCAPSGVVRAPAPSRAPRSTRPVGRAGTHARSRGPRSHRRRRPRRSASDPAPVFPAPRPRSIRAMRSSTRRLRVAVDGTPLLGVRTGVGHLTAALLDALAGEDHVADVELVAYAITLRGRAALASAVPRGVRAATRPLPARGVHALWARADFPAIELWTG